MRKGLLLVLAILLTFLPVRLPYAAAEESRGIKEEVMYYILVDRFNNGDYDLDEAMDVEDPKAYHGGDIPGITLRLNDLQEIGITTIVLSPIMENAPEGYHGFWVEDFYAVEPSFGTMENLDELIEEAHQREMKVVLELPINYVSTTFNANDDWTEPEAREGPEWFSQAVKLNHEIQEVQDELMQVADFWMDETDIDGFQLHAIDQADPEFLANLAEHIKEKDPDFYLLGNVLLTDEGTDALTETTEIDIIPNTVMSEAIVDVFGEVDQPASKLYDAWEAYPNENGILYVDDMYSKRFTQLFAENKRNPVTVWQLTLTYMLTAPGTPLIFQGSENSMYGENAEEAQRLVQTFAGDPEIKEFYNRITSLKAQFPALSYGDFELVGSSGAMSLFKRTYEGETMYIAINNDSTSQYVPITDLDSDLQLRGYLGDNLVRENEDGEYWVGLARESADVFGVEENQGLNWGLIGFAVGVILLFVIAVIILSIKEKQREKQSKQ